MRQRERSVVALRALVDRQGQRSLRRALPHESVGLRARLGEQSQPEQFRRQGEPRRKLLGLGRRGDRGELRRLGIDLTEPLPRE